MFNETDVFQKILGIITEEGNQRIPDADAERLQGFIKFIVELRNLANEQAERPFDLKLFIKVGEKYDAEIAELGKRLSIYTDNDEGTKIIDLLGDCRHVGPFYMFYDLAMTKVANFLLRKLFHSYVKKELYPSFRSQLIAMDNEPNAADQRSAVLRKEAALKST